MNETSDTARSDTLQRLRRKRHPERQITFIPFDI